MYEAVRPLRHHPHSLAQERRAMDPEGLKFQNRRPPGGQGTAGKQRYSVKLCTRPSPTQFPECWQPSAHHPGWGVKGSFLMAQDSPRVERGGVPQMSSTLLILQPRGTTKPTHRASRQPGHLIQKMETKKIITITGGKGLRSNKRQCRTE